MSMHAMLHPLGFYENIHSARVAYTQVAIPVYVRMCGAALTLRNLYIFSIYFVLPIYVRSKN